MMYCSGFDKIKKLSELYGYTIITQVLYNKITYKEFRKGVRRVIPINYGFHIVDVVDGKWINNKQVHGIRDLETAFKIPLSE